MPGFIKFVSSTSHQLQSLDNCNGSVSLFFGSDYLVWVCFGCSFLWPQMQKLKIKLPAAVFGPNPLGNGWLHFIIITHTHNTLERTMSENLIKFPRLPHKHAWVLLASNNFKTPFFPNQPWWCCCIASNDRSRLMLHVFHSELGGSSHPSCLSRREGML